MEYTKDSRFMTLAEVGRSRYVVDLPAGSLSGSESKTIQIVLDTTHKIKGAVDNYQITHDEITSIGSTLSVAIANNLNLRFEVGYNEQNNLVAYVWLYNASTSKINYTMQHFEVDVCYFMPPENTK